MRVKSILKRLASPSFLKWFLPVAFPALFVAAAYGVNYKRFVGGLIVTDSVKIGANTAPNASALLDLESTSQGMAPPRMTEAQRDAISTPATGLVVFNTDTGALNVYSGSAWAAVGSGSGSGQGGINYITNPDAETDTTGWAAYADAAGTSPVDGTGGSPTAAITRTTTGGEVLRGDASFKIAKDAANRQGEGVSFDFTVDPADQSSVLRISFDYSASSAFDYGDASSPASDPSDVVVYIYDKDGASLIQPAGFSLDGSGHFSGEFQPTDNSSNDYRLTLHIAGTNASAWDFFVDNVQVGPQPRVSGVPASDWVDIGSLVTISAGFGTATNVSIFQRRVGDNYEIRGSFQSGTVAGSTAYIQIPWSMDTSKLGGTAADAIGHWYSATASVTAGNWSFDGSTNSLAGAMFFDGSTANQIFLGKGGQNNGYVKTNGSTILANGDSVGFYFTIPIAGLSANVALSEDADTRVVSVNLSRSTSFNIANAGSGTDIPFNADNDTHGKFNGGTSIYTIPVSGEYDLSAALEYASSATGIRELQAIVTIGGSPTTYTLARDSAPPAASLYLHGHKGIYLNAGDTVKFVAYQTSGGVLAAAANGVQYSYASIKKRSGPATIAASEKVYASYNAFSNTGSVNSGAGDLIVWSTKEDDSHNAMSAGTYTIPRSGVYKIEAQVPATNGAATDTMEARIAINGTVKRTKVETASGTTSRPMQPKVSYVKFLNAGDTVTILGRDGTGGASYASSATEAYLHIESD